MLFGSDLFRNALRLASFGCWQADDAAQEGRGFDCFDVGVADEELGEEALVDLAAGAVVAGPVQLCDVTEDGFEVDEVLDGALEGLLDLASLVVEQGEFVLDAIDFGGEEVGGHLVVVVELEELLPFIQQLGSLLVESLVVGGEIGLACGERFFDELAEFGDLVGVESNGVVEAFDGCFDVADVEVSLPAVVPVLVAVLVAAEAEEVLVGAAATVGDLDAVAGLALDAEDRSLEVVGVLPVLLVRPGTVDFA